MKHGPTARVLQQNLPRTPPPAMEAPRAISRTSPEARMGKGRRTPLALNLRDTESQEFPKEGSVVCKALNTVIGNISRAWPKACGPHGAGGPTQDKGTKVRRRRKQNLQKGFESRGGFC